MADGLRDDALISNWSMAFYIKPPGGFGTLERLRVFALRRMNFLEEVENCAEATDFQRLLEKGTTAVDSECLIEGSKKDRISHFLLRLVCSSDAELSSFLVKAETELFCHRFSCMNSEELVQFLKATHRFLSRLQRYQKHTEAQNSASPSRARPVLSSVIRSQKAYSMAVSNLQGVLDLILEAAGSWKWAVELYMDYSSLVFAVPFQHALCLVASRQVTLDGGMAFVPFSNLHIVLAALFEDILREGIRVAKHVPHHFLEDARMRSIAREVHAAFQSARAGYRSKALREPVIGNVIREYQIDHLHNFFPPCMSHLHQTLRKKHRLRHFSRIQYTLFLKSIGLPVDDAIHFWKNEYSKPLRCHDDRSGGCQHSWTKDERRYTYSIRHLYGLEGSRINYRAHSCKAIQMMQLGYGEEGGCPFRHFDDSSLQRLMDIEEIAGPQKESITSESQKGKYNVACRKYLHAKQSQISSHCGRVSHRLEEDRKEVNCVEESSESGPCCPVKGTGSTPEVGLAECRGHGVNVDSPVQKSVDVAEDSLSTLMKGNDVTISEVPTGISKHAGYENDPRPFSPNHVDEMKPSVNVVHRTACNSPTTSCNITDIKVESVDILADAARKCNSGDASLLPCKSSVATGLCKGCNCECAKPFSTTESSMSKGEIRVNVLKRESAIDTGGDSHKVPKLTSISRDSYLISGRVSTNYEALVKDKTMVHEGETIRVPSCDRGLLVSPSVGKSSLEVSSTKNNVEESVSDSTCDVEDLNILRPSDFYFDFRKMVLNFSQTKPTE